MAPIRKTQSASILFVALLVLLSCLTVATVHADEKAAELTRLFRAGQYAEAIPLAEDMLATAEKTLGPEHSDVADILHALGVLYWVQRRYEEAETTHRRALAVREETVGAKHPHPDVADSLNNLALVYRSQGRHREADPLHRRALAILEETAGPDHSDIVWTLENLSILTKRLGNWEESAKLSARARAMRKRLAGRR
jgi:tetratricopeptide (TPR) repeat protein